MAAAAAAAAFECPGCEPKRALKYGDVLVPDPLHIAAAAVHSAVTGMKDFLTEVSDAAAALNLSDDQVEAASDNAVFHGMIADAVSKAAAEAGVGAEWDEAVGHAAAVAKEVGTAKVGAKDHHRWLFDHIMALRPMAECSKEQVDDCRGRKERLRRLICEAIISGLGVGNKEDELLREKKYYKLVKARHEVGLVRQRLHEKANPEPVNPVFPADYRDCAFWSCEETRKATCTLTKAYPLDERGVVRGTSSLHPDFEARSEEILETVLAVMDITAKARTAMTRLKYPHGGFTMLPTNTVHVLAGNQLHLNFDKDNTWKAEVGVVRTKEGKAVCINTDTICIDKHEKREPATGAADKEWRLEISNDAASLIKHLRHHNGECCFTAKECEHDHLEMSRDIIHHYFFGDERMAQRAFFGAHPVEFVHIYQAFFHEIFTKADTSLLTALRFFHSLSTLTDGRMRASTGVHKKVFMQAVIGEMWSKLALESAVAGGRPLEKYYSDTDFAKTVTTLDEILATEPEDGIAAPSAGKRSRA